MDCQQIGSRLVNRVNRYSKVYLNAATSRVCMRPGESWNFILTFSRTGKTWNKTVGPGKSWKSAELKQ